MGIKFYDSNGKYWGEYDETRNLFIPFKKRTMRDCYNCKKYETEGECIECKFEPKDEPQMITMVKDHGRKQALEMINLYHELKNEPRTERSE